MPRRLIISPWTPEQDDRLKFLSAQGATAIRASAALSKPLTSVKIRARKLGIPLPGVREVKAKIRASAQLDEIATRSVIMKRKRPAGQSRTGVGDEEAATS